jgi:hypothetical protein
MHTKKMKEVNDNSPLKTDDKDPRVIADIIRLGRALIRLKLKWFSTNDLGHGPWGVFQKALKIMDHRKTQAGQEKTIFPLATSEIQDRAFQVFSLQERGEGL